MVFHPVVSSGQAAFLFPQKPRWHPNSSKANPCTHLKKQAQANLWISKIIDNTLVMLAPWRTVVGNDVREEETELDLWFALMANVFYEVERPLKLWTDVCSSNEVQSCLINREKCVDETPYGADAYSSLVILTGETLYLSESPSLNGTAFFIDLGRKTHTPWAKKKTMPVKINMFRYWLFMWLSLIQK